MDWSNRENGHLPLLKLEHPGTLSGLPPVPQTWLSLIDLIHATTIATSSPLVQIGDIYYFSRSLLTSFAVLMAIPILPICSKGSSGRKRKRDNDTTYEGGEEEYEAGDTFPMDQMSISFNVQRDIRDLEGPIPIPDWDSDAQHPRDCTCSVCEEFYAQHPLGCNCSLCENFFYHLRNS